MKKLFYLTLLLICFSLLFLSCEKEEIIIENQNNNTLIALQNSFKKESFSKIIPYEFEVNWNNIDLHYSNELKTNYYEFPIVYKNTYNPDNISNFNNRRKTTYKILITKKNKESYNAYIIKFISEKNIDQIENKNIFFSNTKGFSGYIHLFDNENDLVYAKKLEEGINKSGKLLLKKDFKNKLTQKRVEEDCITVATYHYKDWYKVWNDEDGYHIVYMSTEFLGVTYDTQCTDIYFPDSSGNGGGGGGTYNGSSDSGPYQSCTKCLYKIEDAITIVANAPDTPIQNMEAHLDCFDTSQNATVTIYADQPNPNNPNLDHYMFNVGHSFITIQQGEHNVSYGFYPAEGVGYFDATDGVMGNNENYAYDVSVTINISGSTLQNLITHSISYSNSDYDLTDSNCTSFAISSSNLIGLNVPLSECIGLYGLGNTGATPAAFGNYLRNMDLPEGATRNTSGGTSPNDNGCN